MPVVICRSKYISDVPAYDHWCSIDRLCPLEPGKAIPDLAQKLEHTYDTIAETWWDLARSLSAEPSAMLAHAPACVANVSDLGLMLAWDRLVRQWQGRPSRVLVICDDPWLFRHLAGIAPSIGQPPPLWLRRLTLEARGLFARLRVAVRLGFVALRLRRTRHGFPRGSAALLVYGHPTSHADGMDGYFGRLMNVLPALRRVLHIDCGISRVRSLMKEPGYTFTLHAWGPLRKTLLLPFARWRPSKEHRHGAFGWLIRRAACLEGSTGQPAMIRWQQICQEAWLSEVRPTHVAWPWENHAWERVLVSHARRLGIKTIGYQHATVGTREWNHSPRSSQAEHEGLPDLILVSGAPWERQLLAFGCPPSRLRMAGAWRAPKLGALPYDPRGPVFVALPADAGIATELIEAVRPLAARGLRFEIKDHPMSPFRFAEEVGVTRASGPLNQHKGVSAVLYAATTMGLEALVGGLPTLRFQPRAQVPNDIAAAFSMPFADAHALEGALSRLRRPVPMDAEAIFAAPRLDIWREAFDQLAHG